MKLSKREKLLMAFVLLLGLGAVYFFYFLQPFMSEMKKINEDIVAKRSECDVLEVQESQIGLLEDQISGLQEQKKAAMQNLPTGYDQAEILPFIQTTIEKNAQKVRYDFDEPLDLVKLESAKAELEFFTDYAHLKIILSELKKCPFNNRVTFLNAVIGKEGNGGDVNKEDGEDKKDDESKEDSENKEDDKSKKDKKDAPKYDINVFLTLEFFDFKGSIPDKNYDYDTKPEGKSDPFAG